MRQFLIVIVILAGMLAVGFGLLFRNLGQGIVQEEPQHQQPAPTPVPEPPAVAAADTIARIMVSSPDLEALRAENEALKARVTVLEQKQPRTRGELAAIVGVKESEVDHLLDRSELLPNARLLCEAIQISGAQSVWKALQAESSLYHSFARFKAENPVGDDRMTWHHARWAPFLERSITALCGQLYQLNMPSSVVEPFRLKLLEGI